MMKLRIKKLLEEGRTEVKTKHQLEKFPLGSLISYVSKEGQFRRGGTIIKFADEYFIYLSYDGKTKVRARYINISKIWVKINTTFTLTFGDQAENNVGMKKIGVMAKCGFNYDDLIKAKCWFESKGIVATIYDLSKQIRKDQPKLKFEDAYLLIASNGLSAICNPRDFYKEQESLRKDTKALIRGRVVNKRARYNLCFDDVAIDPDYENGQGTVVAFKDVPLLESVRNTLPDILGEKAVDLKCEGNYYTDISRKSGISYHGDAERKLVIGVRVGASMPLRFQWFYKTNAIGSYMNYILNDGDLYFSSSKAVGTDWKLRNTPTLRHCAGCNKYLQIKKK